MKEMFIGEVIKERRNELHITQANLCDGICESVTISRLENNNQTPSRKTVKAILQRLGLPDDRYYAVITGKEIEIDKLYEEIISYNIQFEKATGMKKAAIRKKAIAAHSKLEKKISKKDSISRQLIMRSRVIMGPEDGKYTEKEKIVMLSDALKMTQPRFSLDTIKDGYFDFEEIKLIHHIALTYSEDGRHDIALSIWEQLLENINKRFERIVPARTQKCLVLAGYSRELGMCGKYKEAISYAQEGVEICLEYGVYQKLPELKMILAECNYLLGNKDISKEQFVDSYYLCRVVKDEINKKIAASSLNEYFKMVVD